MLDRHAALLGLEIEARYARCDVCLGRGNERDVRCDVGTDSLFRRNKRYFLC
jgi:hypothetical protein